MRIVKAKTISRKFVSFTSSIVSEHPCFPLDGRFSALIVQLFISQCELYTMYRSAYLKFLFFVSFNESIPVGVKVQAYAYQNVSVWDSKTGLQKLRASNISS